MASISKALEKEIGEGLVQTISITETKKGKWEWKYRNPKNSRIEKVVCSSREEAEEYHMQCGGKNPETAKAADIFLEFGRWKAEDIIALGHRPTKVMVKGRQVLNDDTWEREFPEETGSTPLTSKHKTGVSIRDTHVRNIQFTRIFNSPEELDTLLSFLKNDDHFKKFSWTLYELGTVSEKTPNKLACVWKRTKVGDGTKRMALQLTEIEGRHYTEHIRNTVYAAAGDMFDAPCSTVTMKKKTEHTEKKCVYAAEDGKYNIENYETIS